MRFASVSALVAVLVAGVSSQPSSAAQEAVSVAVFEGRGLGHGVGLPLDGANYLAVEENADADAILDHFFPDTSTGRREGLVRVEVGGADDVREGIEVVLPDGGEIRDGRQSAVAPSFPVSVPPGGRVKLWFEDERHRAEVLDGTSVTGTKDAAATSTTSSTAPASAASETTEPAFPELAASENSLWVIAGGAGAVLGGEDAERVTDGAIPARLEVLVEAERLFVVAELDIEDYLRNLALVPPDSPPLEPATLEAAVVAARSYALRAAAADLEVGRFHVHGDERAFPFAGPEQATEGIDEAVAATSGRVRIHGGHPAATMITLAGGGVTADPGEVFGDVDGERPYLRSIEYETGLASPWRVDMALADVAARLGYEGSPEAVTVTRTGTSGRPVELAVTGDAGTATYDATAFHRALRLPSSSFTVAVEKRDGSVPERQESPPFQELPGVPVAEEPIAVADTPHGARDEGSGLPPLYVLAAIGAFGISLVVLLLANLQRAVSARRARRASRRRHPTATPSPAPPPATDPPPSEATQVSGGVVVTATRVGTEPEPEPELEPEPAAPPTAPPDDLTAADLAWLDELLDRRDPPAPDDGESDDDRLGGRSPRQVLGWEDAPDWLDD